MKRRASVGSCRSLVDVEAVAGPTYRTSDIGPLDPIAGVTWKGATVS